MQSRLKLTKAQLELLRELPTTCVREYKPAQVLVEQALAEWRTEASATLTITNSGRAALAKEGE